MVASKGSTDRATEKINTFLQELDTAAADWQAWCTKVQEATENQPQLKEQQEKVKRDLGSWERSHWLLKAGVVVNHPFQ